MSIANWENTCRKRPFRIRKKECRSIPHLRSISFYMYESLYKKKKKGKRDEKSGKKENGKEEKKYFSMYDVPVRVKPVQQRFCIGRTSANSAERCIQPRLR